MPNTVEMLDRRLLLSTDVLVFTIPPVSTDAGVYINSPGGFQVTVETSTGQPDIANSDRIVVLPGPKINPGIGGTHQVNAVNGVANFSQFEIISAVTAATLVAYDNTDTSIASVTSPTFTVYHIPVYGNIKSLTANSAVNDGLVTDNNTNVYGTTESGGVYGDGSVFELPYPTNQTLVTILSFSGSSGPTPGLQPEGGMVRDSSGNLFGSTELGGLYNGGTVFELSGADQSTFSSLASFSGGAPAGLTVDASGNIFGVTLAVPGVSYGTVFELAAGHYATVETLAVFTGISGSNPGDSPYGHLLLDSSGDLLGTTSAGGSAGLGTVFELSGSNYGNFTTLVSFTGASGAFPGSQPFGGLIGDGSGNLLGSTTGDGVHSLGTVFELSGSDHDTFKNLITFTGSAGAYPGIGPSALLISPYGNVYGTTQSGSLLNPQFGTVFELAASTYAFSTVTPLLGSVASSYGAVTLAYGWDTLLGATSTGGKFGQGSLFQLNQNYGTAAISQNTASTTTFGPPAGDWNVLSFPSISAGSTAIVVFAPAVSLPAVVMTQSLNIQYYAGWFGQIDITDNDMDIAVGDLATVTSQVAQTYARGLWNRFGGIRSSTAAADSTHLSTIATMQNNQSGGALYSAANPFDGTVPGISDILVKDTYYGDANLDGKVDGSDYSLIDNGVASHSTGWFNGDFNYDGLVDGSDYTLMDNAFNRQGASLLAAVAPTDSVASLRSVRSAVSGLQTAALPGLPMPAQGAASLFMIDEEQSRRRLPHNQPLLAGVLLD